MSKVTSIRLSDELADRLDQLAATLDRPRSWLIEQAVARYVEQEAFEIAAIGEALAAYRGGGAPLHPHDAVMARIEARISPGPDDARPLA